MLLDDDALALTRAALCDVLRAVGTSTGAVRADNLARNRVLGGVPVVHERQRDLEVGEHRRRPRRLLPAAAEELRERVRRSLLLLVPLQRRFAASVVDSPQLRVSLTHAHETWGIAVTNLIIGQDLVRCYQLRWTRQLDIPRDSSINLSCASFSGFRSGWYFFDIFCLSALTCVKQLTRYAFLISASPAFLSTVGQLDDQKHYSCNSRPRML